MAMMDKTRIEIRKGKTADVFAIGRVLVAAWRDTFRGLIDEDYLKALSPAEQALRHMGRRGTPGVRHVVAIDRESGAVIGFANFGPARGPAANATHEIYALYLLPEYQRDGIGRGLVKAVAVSVLDDGGSDLFAWVLSTNPNRRFYHRLGAVPTVRSTIRLGDRNHEQVAYCWHDLPDLLARESGQPWGWG